MFRPLTRFFLIALAFNTFPSLQAIEIEGTDEKMEEYFNSSLVRIECSIKPIERRESSHKKVAGYKPTGIRESTSTNWAGYAVATKLGVPASGTVKTVFGQWIIPTLSATPNTSYSSIWVGIDGYSNGTVEQIGTESDWVNGAQQNYAWFEMYPQDSYQIMGFPVDEGDYISAAVNYVGSGQFTMIIANNSKNVFSQIPLSSTISTTALRSSAEWIVEAPSNNFGELELADFGQTFVFGCLANINGIIGAINNSNWQYDALTMASGTATKANVSPLTTTASDNGSQFLVTWAHE